MQDYENLSPAPESALLLKKGRHKSDFARARDYTLGFVIPMIVGAVLCAILFTFLPCLINYHLTGLDWNYSSQYAINEVHFRYSSLLHGDFANYKDWGFPLMGMGIAVCLKLLYDTD
jgi:hypothetical protein